MKTYFFTVFTTVCVVSSGLLLTGLQAAQAQAVLPLPPPPTLTWPEPEMPDPERWTQEDVTLEQKFDTARKEVLAAHQEALKVCQSMHTTEQTDCITQARAGLELELAKLKAKARFGLDPN